MSEDHFLNCMKCVHCALLNGPLQILKLFGTLNHQPSSNSLYCEGALIYAVWGYF